MKAAVTDGRGEQFRVQALACGYPQQQPEGYPPTRAARVGTPVWTLNYLS